MWRASAGVLGQLRVDLRSSGHVHADRAEKSLNFWGALVLQSLTVVVYVVDLARSLRGQKPCAWSEASVTSVAW